MNTKTFWACGLLAAGLLSSGPLLAQIASAADTAAPAPDVQAQIDAAMATETRGRYSAALSLWQPLADSGLAEAQYRIGRIYAWGLGVCKNETAAADWLTRAAGQGHILAQQQLGYLYLAQGQASFAKAKSWFLKAAQAGDAESQYRLGQLVTGDKPTPAQYREAAAWYEKAALQGHIPAMMELGRLNRDGLGVVKTPAKAAYWYRKAAELGDDDAKFELGHLYETGSGVAKDLVQADKWYILATHDRQGGNSAAFDSLDRIEPHMTPAQKADADAQAQAVFTVHPDWHQPPPLMVPPVRSASCPS